MSTKLTTAREALMSELIGEASLLIGRFENVDHMLKKNIRKMLSICFLMVLISGVGGGFLGATIATYFN